MLHYYRSYRFASNFREHIEEIGKDGGVVIHGANENRV